MSEETKNQLEVPKIYTTLVSNDQMKKESEEVTKRELEILMSQIKNNPKLLKPKQILSQIESESSDDSTYSSESEYSSSSSSSSSSSERKHKKYYKKNNDNIEIYKQEGKIDDLEKKLYYKTLRLSNMTLDNSKLQNENENLKIKFKENEILVSILLNIIDFPIEEISKKLENINKDNIFNKRMILEESFENNKKNLDVINKKLNDISNEKIKKYYHDELFKINNKIIQKYEENNKIINNFMNNIKYNDRIYNILFMIIGGIFILFLKEIFIFDKF
jgi:hypothetical protein